MVLWGDAGALRHSVRSLLGIPLNLAGAAARQIGTRNRARLRTLMSILVMPAGLMRREEKAGGNLLLRLDEAVMQSAVENGVICDLKM